MRELLATARQAFHPFPGGSLLATAEALEPPRGAGTHVSEAVVAVDNDRLVLLELRRGLVIEHFQGDIDRTGKMLLLIRLCREHFYELSTVLNEPVNAVMCNFGRHAAPPFLVCQPLASSLRTLH